MSILKILCLFVGVWFSIINFGRMKYEQYVSHLNILIQTLGIVGFIVIQFKLY